MVARQKLGHAGLLDWPKAPSTKADRTLTEYSIMLG